MKKEKQVKSYQRRTKSGKMVTVRAHTATYDAAEAAKEAAKKVGAGKELEERKKKPVQLEIPFDKEEEKKVLDEVKETVKKESTKKPAEKKTTAKTTRYASGAKLNEDGTFVSEKDYKKSIAHRKRKGARISPEEVKAIKKWESGHKESKVRPVGSGTNGPEPKKKSETKSAAISSVKRDPTDVEFLARQIAQSHSGSLDAARNKVNNMSDRTYRSWLRSYGVLKDKKSSKATSSAKTTKASEPAFTAAEFKEWYRGTGSAADKKVEKALKKQLGREGYRKLEDEAIDNYSSRGHLSMFKRVGGGIATKSAKIESTKGTEHKVKPTSFSGQTQLKQEMAMWKKSPTSAMGKASRNNITKLLQEKKKQGYKLTKREEAFLG